MVNVFLVILKDASRRRTNEHHPEITALPLCDRVKRVTAKMNKTIIKCEQVSGCHVNVHRNIESTSTSRSATDKNKYKFQQCEWKPLFCIFFHSVFGFFFFILLFHSALVEWGNLNSISTSSSHVPSLAFWQLFSSGLGTSAWNQRSFSAMYLW